MKKIISILTCGCLLALGACNENSNTTASAASPDSTVVSSGQEAVKDDISAKDVVKIAVGSKDHTTLVEALKQADLVTSLSNAGPFTVFAPTNEAFQKLPAGVLEGLMKPEKKSDLQNILQYHVSVGVYKPESLKDGQIIGQANGDNITISAKDGKLVVNGKANVITSIPASNGIIYVIDAVLTPPEKK